MKLLSEATTVEFYIDSRDQLWVEFNRNKPMLFKHFVLLAKSDDEANHVLAVVKDQMEKYRYNGSMIDFIRGNFGEKNKQWDVFIPDGVPNNFFMAKARVDTTEFPGK